MYRAETIRPVLTKNCRCSEAPTTVPSREVLDYSRLRPACWKTDGALHEGKYGFFLVLRLTGYTVDTALELIERANQSLGQRGTFVLDLATNRNNSGYKFWNDDLYTANTTLNASMGLPVFDEETEFLTNVSNVMGYASWGSNDGLGTRTTSPTAALTRWTAPGKAVLATGRTPLQRLHRGRVQLVVSNGYETGWKRRL